MAERILEFLTNLLKIGKEQLFLKSEFLRNKVPIKPVLGLTGLGVLIIAVRPLLTNSQSNQIESTITPTDKQPKVGEEYDLRRTLYLMREKEKQLKRRAEAEQQQQQES